MKNAACKPYLAATGLVLAATTLWSLLEASYYFVGWDDVTYLPEEHTWGLEIVFSLLIWCPWALLAPLLLYLCRRFPLDKGVRLRRFLLHFAFSLGIGLVKALMESLLSILILSLPLDILAPKILLGILAYESVFYWVFLAAYSGVTYYRRYKEREVSASRLEAQLAQAKLDALKLPLRPHFLFNTLHSISVLIHDDAGAAEKMVCRLSDLLRLSLKYIDLREIPLRREMEFLDRYIEILRIRFGDDLVVEMEIPEAVRDALVPPLLIQPIVENAVNHGIDPGRLPARITVKAFKKDGMLCIEVADNGPGLPTGGAVIRGGIGLKNTTARLKQLYGDRGMVSFHEAEGGGLRVRLSLPFHTETPPPVTDRSWSDEQDSNHHRG